MSEVSEEHKVFASLWKAR